MWYKSETFIGTGVKFLVNRWLYVKVFVLTRYFHGIVCQVQRSYYPCTHLPRIRYRSLLPDVAIAERTSNIRPTKLTLRIVN
jgi:hypothetical protein